MRLNLDSIVVAGDTKAALNILLNLDFVNESLFQDSIPLFQLKTRRSEINFGGIFFLYTDDIKKRRNL